MTGRYLITKELPSIPFAHRQWKHAGHCRFIHGHNWTFSFQLEVDNAGCLNDCGFVVDFADFKALREYINTVLDHSFVVLRDDPFLTQFSELHNKGVIKMVVLDGASAEQMAEWFANNLRSFLYSAGHTPLSVRVRSVTCREDEKNTATFYPT